MERQEMVALVVPRILQELVDLVAVFPLFFPWVPTPLGRVVVMA